jgi:hypothetical protein
LSSPFGFPDAFADEVSFSAFGNFPKKFVVGNRHFAVLTVPCNAVCHKKTEVFKIAFLSVGGLLPEDSILKERLVLFQLIE